MIDHFWRLRIAWDADDDTIRHAYHRLAREVHPDLTPANAPARERRRRQHAMARLNESFAVLEDPTARAEHRRALEAQRARRHPRRATVTMPTAPAAPARPRPTAPRAPAPHPTPDAIDDEWTWPGFASYGGGAPVRRPARNLSWRVRLGIYLGAALVALLASAFSDDTTEPAPTVPTMTLAP